jgi:hypothetical protein
MATDIVPASALKPPAKRVAARAIEDVHLAFYQAEGIRDTANKLESQLVAAARHVYSLALFAAKQHPKDLGATSALFLGLCDYAETSYKTEHEVDNLRQGLNPLDFKTEGKFRSKAMEVISKKRLAQLPPEGEEPGEPETPQYRGPEEIGSFVDSTVIPDSLKHLIAQVVYAAEVVKANRVAQAEEILREAWQKLGALVDRRKTKVPPAEPPGDGK